MIDLVPPKNWPVLKHSKKDMWIVRNLHGHDCSPWMLSHCRAVAEAWGCRSKELEAQLTETQKQETIYREEVARYKALNNRDEYTRPRIVELEKKCAALGRVNDDLEGRCTELQRRLAHRQVST